MADHHPTERLPRAALVGPFAELLDALDKLEAAGYRWARHAWRLGILAVADGAVETMRAVVDHDGIRTLRQCEDALRGRRGTRPVPAGGLTTRLRRPVCSVTTNLMTNPADLRTLTTEQLAARARRANAERDSSTIGACRAESNRRLGVA